MYRPLDVTPLLCQNVFITTFSKFLLPLSILQSPDEDATQYPQQSKDDGTQCYIPGRGIIVSLSRYMGSKMCGYNLCTKTLH